MSRVRLICGVPGAGKTSFVVSDILRYRKRFPLAPVCSSVPLVLPGDGPTILATTVGHYIAFGTVISPRDVLAALSKKGQGCFGRVLAMDWGKASAGVWRVVQEAEKTDFAEKVEQFVQGIDWKSKGALAEAIEQHNRRVLGNWRPGIHPSEFLFDYQPPPFDSVCFIDEGGVMVGSDMWRELSQGAFYDWLCQVRKLDVQLWMTAHTPARVAKVVRELVSEFVRLASIKVGKRGRICISVTYRTEEDFDKREHGSIRVRWVPRQILRHYQTYFIVQSSTS